MCVQEDDFQADLLCCVLLLYIGSVKSKNDMTSGKVNNLSSTKISEVNLFAYTYEYHKVLH